MTVVQDYLSEQLTKALGQIVSEHDVAQVLKLIEFFAPSPGKLIWQVADAPIGIYVVLAGRVRLLDSNEELVISLQAGACFGELTLFPGERFQAYSVRASQDLQLCFLPVQCLQALVQKYPGIRDRLRYQATLRDLLLTTRQIPLLHKVSRPNLLMVLSLMQRAVLPVGALPDQELAQQQLWLIRRGELRHSSGMTLTAGNLYGRSQLPKTGHWQVTEPTEWFGLAEADLETVLVYVPQLRDWMSSLPAQFSRGSASTTTQPVVHPAPAHFAGSSFQARPAPRSTAIKQSNRDDPRSATTFDRTSATLPSHSFSPNLDAAIPSPPSGSTVDFSPSSSRPLEALPTLASTFPVPSVASHQINQAYFPSPTIRIRHWWQQVSQHYPFFEQQSASDCGVACLVMIGQYWGKRFSINHLRQAANVSRSGASLRGLIQAAEAIGFTTRPIKAALAGLAQQPLPAIAHWEGKHYIVVYRITRTEVLVADPAIGRRQLSHAEFQAGWTGYTLLLQPTALFKDAAEAKPQLWKFFALLKPHRLVLAEILVASILLQVFGLFTPLFTQLLLDRVVVQRSSSTFFAVGTGLIIFSLFALFISSLRRYLLYHTANRIDLSLAVGFITHTFRLPLNYFDTRYVGDITSRIQENRNIRSFLTGDALTTLLDLLTVVVYVGLMFWYSWFMALLVLAIVPIYLMLAIVTTPFLQQVSREVFNAKTTESSYLIEALTGVNTVKSMGVERPVRWQWEDLFIKFIKVNFSGQMIRERLRLLSSLVDTLFSRGIFLFGIWLVIQEQLTIGQLVAFNMLLGNVLSPFQRLISLWNDFQEVLISMERINDVIDTVPEEDFQALALPALPPIKGQICFDQVTFRYDAASDRNTLEDLSFAVQPGQMVAIVGRSGSGKTTIAKLLLGLYAPTAGRVLVDGQDIATIALRSLRQQIGVVDQDTFLFGGTIQDNLRLAHPQASVEEIKTAASLAGADLFIQDFPLKYDTQVGEGGSLLSGGQRQRLAIARALLGNPRLLILDEATSSLDAESERVIQNNLNLILQNRTTLVIAHRLSTVRNADLILVMEKGRLIEQGTHEELMKKRGQYYYLNQQQLAIAE